jgi:hypothetical protein
VDVVGDFVAGEFECRRPEERVKVDDVLADEMDLLDVGIRLGEGLEVEAAPRAMRAAKW